MYRLSTLDELRRLVLETLCMKSDLDLQTPIYESAIYRRGQPCGIEFTLFGPRSLRLSAIWEALANRVLFYDQDLERFQVLAVQGPTVEAIAEVRKSDFCMKSVWKGK